MGNRRTKIVKRSRNSKNNIYVIICIALFVALAISDSIIIFQHIENTRLKNEISEREVTLTKREGLLKSIINYRAGKVKYKANCMYYSRADLPSPLNVVAFREDEVLSKIYTAYDSGHYDVASFLCEY